MTASLWYALTAITLFVIGMYGLIACEHPLRKLLGVNIMGSGVFLLLVSGAHRRAGDVPDPVPHAMVLTGIVVAVSTTALALALARRVRTSARSDPSADE